jgi:hypothetical protein
MIRMMNLPAYEMAFLDKMVVVHDAHLTGLVVMPLVVALGLLVCSKRYFGQRYVPGSPGAS